MKYFISHSSRDADRVNPFIGLIPRLDPKVTEPGRDIFYSSEPETGSDAKDTLLPNIDSNIAACEIIILVVTENYLRSSFCFYELSLASMYKRQGKPAILIVQNREVYERISELFPGSLFIDASEQSCADTLIAAITGKTGGPGILSAEERASLDGFFAAVRDVPSPVKPFLGMSKKQYEKVYSFPETNKVENMTFGYPATAEVMAERLKGAKELIFVSTTGSGFLKSFKKPLIDAVSGGAGLTVVMAERDSDFAKDVGDIEIIGGGGQQELALGNRRRISSEFESSVQYLNEIHREAAAASAISGVSPGVIRCCPSYTLIRQTAFAARYGDTAWGWITCTMPPERSADKTPSFVVSGNTDADPFISAVWRYCRSLVELAAKRNDGFVVDGNSAPQSFGTESVLSEDLFDSARAYWQEKYLSAKKYMEDRDYLYDAVLIEVAAQHPLRKRTEPNDEFRKRLDKAAELYEKLTEEGQDVSIYVPGSRHKFGGVVDDISLSEAGCNYLRKRGIPADALLGDAENVKYKGESGVYNSADECLVASQIFKDGSYGKLICVCAPNQIMRKTLFYLEFGCLPLCYGVTTEKMFHGNIVDEIFQSLNPVLYLDHSWQGENSEASIKTREQRKP